MSDDLTTINYLGAQSEERLNDYGIRTFADLAACSVEKLVEMFGRHNSHYEEWLVEARKRSAPLRRIPTPGRPDLRPRQGEGPLVHLAPDRFVQRSGQTLAPNRSTRTTEAHGVAEGQTRVVVDDVFEHAIEIHGEADRVRVERIEKTFDKLTVEAWVRPRAALGDDPTLLLSADHGETPAWALLAGSNVTLEWNDPEAGPQLCTPTPPVQLATDRWSHLAFTADGSNVHLWVDGRLAATTSWRQGFPWSMEGEPSRQPLVVGGVTSSWRQRTIRGDDDREVTVAFGARSMVHINGGVATVCGLDCKPRHILEHGSFVWTAAISPDGTQVATCTDETIRIFDIGNPSPRVEMASFMRQGTAVFSPDGRFLLTTGSPLATPYAYLWDTASGEPILGPTVHDNLRHDDWKGSGRGRRGGPDRHRMTVAFSTDGETLLTTNQCTARTWNLGGREMRVIEHIEIGDVYSARETYYDIVHADFSRDRRIVTVGNDSRANIWWADSGQRLGEPIELKTHASSPGWAKRGAPAKGVRAHFSPDGSIVAIFKDDGWTSLYDVESQHRLVDLPGTAVDSWSQANPFSRDGRYLVTIDRFSQTRPVLVFDLETRESVAALSAPEGARKASFSPDGSRVFAQTRTMAVVHSRARSRPFEGRLAHLRVFDRVVIDNEEEMRERLESEIRKDAKDTFFPLEFSLLNPQDQPVLYLGNVPRSLTLKVENRGFRNILLPHGPKTGHLELRFPPGTLTSPEEVTLSAPEGCINPTLDESASWSLHHRSEPDGTDVFELSRSSEGGGAAAYTLTRNETLSLRLTGIVPDRRPGTHLVQVLLSYDLHYDEHKPLRGSRPHDLVILQMPEAQMHGQVADAQSGLDGLETDFDERDTSLKERIGALHDQAKDREATAQTQRLAMGAPLTAGIHGATSVFCDGLLKNSLAVRISNQSDERVELAVGDCRSEIFVDFGEYPDHPWGLGTRDDLRSIRIEGLDASEWSMPERTTTGFSFHKINQAGEIGDRALEFKLTNFTCSAPPGRALINVRYHNIGKAVEIAHQPDAGAGEDSGATAAGSTHEYRGARVIGLTNASQISHFNTQDPWVQRPWVVLSAWYAWDLFNLVCTDWKDPRLVTVGDANDNDDDEYPREICETFEEAARYLERNISQGDRVLVVGEGLDELRRALEEREAKGAAGAVDEIEVREAHRGPMIVYCPNVSDLESALDRLREVGESYWAVLGTEAAFLGDFKPAIDFEFENRLWVGGDPDEVRESLGNAVEYDQFSTADRAFKWLYYLGYTGAYQWDAEKEAVLVVGRELEALVQRLCDEGLGGR